MSVLSWKTARTGNAGAAAQFLDANYNLCHGQAHKLAISLVTSQIIFSVGNQME